MHDQRTNVLQLDSRPSLNEIESSSALQEAPEAAEAEFQPLATCPPVARTRFERRARLAADQPMRAIELKCLECCGWSRPEATRCEIRGCPLWLMNRRVFKQRSQGRSHETLRT